MTIKEIIIAILIHLLLPLLGLLCFLFLIKKIKKENIPNAPVVELFIIFSTYGGLLLIVLTDLLWKWSGMASIGTFYLILGAPITLGIIAYRLKKTKAISKYHNYVYLLSLLYFVFAPIAFLGLFLLSKK